MPVLSPLSGPRRRRGRRHRAPGPRTPGVRLTIAAVRFAAGRPDRVAAATVRIVEAVDVAIEVAEMNPDEDPAVRRHGGCGSGPDGRLSHPARRVPRFVWTDVTTLSRHLRQGDLGPDQRAATLARPVRSRQDRGRKRPSCPCGRCFDSCPATLRTSLITARPHPCPANPGAEGLAVKGERSESRSDGAAALDGQNAGPTLLDWERPSTRPPKSACLEEGT